MKREQHVLGRIGEVLARELDGLARREARDVADGLRDEAAWVVGRDIDAVVGRVLGLGVRLVDQRHARREAERAERAHLKGIDRVERDRRHYSHHRA
jgi:hypothetical protein